MILHDAFTVEPWNLRETRLDLDLLVEGRLTNCVNRQHLVQSP